MLAANLELTYILLLLIFSFHFLESPILAHGDLCLQPENGECDPIDNTRLIYVRDTPQCSKNYMVFTYHDDVLTHQCSGKKVCPQGMYT